MLFVSILESALKWAKASGQVLLRVFLRLRFQSSGQTTIHYITDLPWMISSWPTSVCSIPHFLAWWIACLSDWCGISLADRTQIKWHDIAIFHRSEFDIGVKNHFWCECISAGLVISLFCITLGVFLLQAV